MFKRYSILIFFIIVIILGVTLKITRNTAITNGTRAGSPKASLRNSELNKPNQNGLYSNKGIPVDKSSLIENLSPDNTIEKPDNTNFLLSKLSLSGFCKLKSKKIPRKTSINETVGIVKKLRIKPLDNTWAAEEDMDSDSSGKRPKDDLSGKPPFGGYIFSKEPIESAKPDKPIR